MSRFFATGNSSSSEEESDNDEEVQFVETNAPSRNRFMRDDDDSDDEDGGKRVVRSQKDKRLDELRDTLKQMQNAMKINDWNSLLTDFEKLNKQLVKATTFTEGAVPKLYIRALVKLEDFLQKAMENKDAKKKMSSSNAKSLTAMKQKLRKNNKTYESEIEKYRTERPSTAADNEDGADDIDLLGDDEEDNDAGEGSDSDDGADKWKKKEPKSAKPADAPEEAKEEKPLTEEELNNKLKEVIALRGKKGTDRMEQIEQLQKLLGHAVLPAQRAEVLSYLVSAQFDINTNMVTHMAAAHWHSALQYLRDLLAHLKANAALIPKDEPSEDQPALEGFGLFVANVLTFSERLDDELYRSLQYIDHHTQEFIERLADDAVFMDLALDVHTYFKSLNYPCAAARIAARRMEHLYYKQNTVATEQHSKREALRKEKEAEAGSTDFVEKELPDTDSLVAALAIEIYKSGSDRIKMRTMLCHIYHHALHGRYYQARDLMLMSHIQDTIQHADIDTQIFYNRTMVQLGMCAFRCGLFADAHSCLAEICAGMRVKELLAQGITPTRFEKTPEQEKQERRRQIPYHMHINLEVLECIHLTSAMLLEVPYMAAHAFDSKKRFISKPFRRMLEFYDRQVFSGPPEQTRDYVMAASHALSKGDWRKSTDLLMSLPLWTYVPNAADVKEMLKKNIQQEGLRTFLLTYSAQYDSLSLSLLVAKFEMPASAVHSLVSKMMIQDELHASWDQPTESIVMHKAEPTRLQHLALQFSDKVSLFVENNERLLDSRTGGYGYKFDAQQGKSHGHDGQAQRQGGGGGGGGNRGPRTQSYGGGHSGAHSGGGGRNTNSSNQQGSTTTSQYRPYH